MVTVRVHPAGTADAERDENGDYVAVPLDPYDLDVISVYPRTSSEPGDPNRTLILSGRTILAYEGAQVGPRDQIEIDAGDDPLWEIDGEVRVWDARSNPLRGKGFRVLPATFPSRRLGCVEINVKRADG